MNQYEIELRDKVALMRLQNLHDSVKPKLTLDSEVVAMCAYDFADAVMTERMRRLDALEEADRSLVIGDTQIKTGGELPTIYICPTCGVKEGEEHNQYCIPEGRDKELKE